MSDPRPASDALVALFGPAVWAGHFFALYLTEALLCTAVSTPAAKVRILGIGLTLLALSALLAFALRHRHAFPIAGAGPSTPSDPLVRLARPLTALSALAVAWTAVPLLLLPPCSVAGS